MQPIARRTHAAVEGTMAFLDRDLSSMSPVVRELRSLGITVHLYDDALRMLARLGTDRPDVVVLSSRHASAGIESIVPVLRAERSVTVLIALAPGDIDAVSGAIVAGARPALHLPYRLDATISELLPLFRSPTPRTEPLTIGDLTLDPASYDVHVGATSIDLSAREFDLLHHLAVRADHVVSRMQLIQRLVPHASEPESTLVAAVSRVRRKLAPVGADASIHTVRGIGYRLESSRLSPCPGARRGELALVP